MIVPPSPVPGRGEDICADLPFEHGIRVAHVKEEPVMVNMIGLDVRGQVLDRATS
jgi:hypothetical protein